MKSLCIKTNNANILKYLLNELKFCNINEIFFSSTNFKIYKNIIIHYTGKNDEYFISEISKLLSILIIDELEENIIMKSLSKNYFYFDTSEKNKIIEIYYDNITTNFYETFNTKLSLINFSIEKYIHENKSLVLDGFINFRLKNYLNFLDELIQESISNYIVQKEYLEFISLLKSYIYSQDCLSDTIHLIYSSSESVLLNDKKEVIFNLNDNLNSKFLSDISFSSNDYTLNSLLTLLPKHLHIHLIDNVIDEFITTLQLIFAKKNHICTDCSICKLYKGNEFKILEK